MKLTKKDNIGSRKIVQSTAKTERDCRADLCKHFWGLKIMTISLRRQLYKSMNFFQYYYFVTERPDIEKTVLRRGYDWFCGYDDSSAGRIKARKQQEHLKKVSSLKQDPKAKIFLNINLVCILLITTTMYIIFTIPGLI